MKNRNPIYKFQLTQLKINIIKFKTKNLDHHRFLKQNRLKLYVVEIKIIKLNTNLIRLIKLITFNNFF